MKSSELKNILLACGMAVFASVFAIGVNAAFGVSAPTITPEDPELVGPTFSEVTTTGDINMGGNLTDLTDGRVNVYANLDVLSGTDANATTGQGPLRIGSDPATRMLIDNNEILSLSELYINHGGDQDVQIGSSGSTSDVEIFGNMIIRYVLNVHDDIDVWGVVKNDNIDPDKPDTDYAVVIDDKLGVSGTATFDSDTSVIGDFTALSNVYISSGDVSISNGNLSVGGDATIPTISGDVDISGAVTASRFGTYNISPNLPPVTIPGGSTGSITRSCPTGQTIISCGVWTESHANVYDLEVTGTNGCIASARNNNTGAINLYVRPRCLDPDA